MKKLTSILLVLALIFSLGMSAMAAAPADPQDTGTITISPVNSYNTVAAYKVIGITQMISDAGKPYDQYFIVPAYKEALIDAINSLGTVDVLADTASDSDVLLYITNSSLSSVEVAKVAKYLETALASATPDNTGSASGSTITISDVELGYYLILDTTTYPATVTVNEISPILGEVNTELKISLKSSTTTVPVKTADEASYNIGDTVAYTVEVVVPYFNLNAYDLDTIEYVVTDTMGTGLTLDSSSIGVSIKGDDTATLVYVEVAGTSSFTLTFGADADIGGLYNYMGETLVIVYSATVNASAPADGKGLINDLETGYIKEEYTGDKETVYTYGIDLIKEDEYGNLLEGVKFELYAEDPRVDDTVLPLTFSERTSGTAGDYLYDSASSTTDLYTDATGELVIWGLAAGTYYLKETGTLDGYNLLTDVIEITIIPLSTDLGLVDDVDDLDAYYDLTVVNYSGVELPSTGGIGTILFTIFGCGIILGGCVLLIVNRKRVFSK